MFFVPQYILVCYQMNQLLMTSAACFFVGFSLRFSCVLATGTKVCFSCAIAFKGMLYHGTIILLILYLSVQFFMEKQLRILLCSESTSPESLKQIPEVTSAQQRNQRDPVCLQESHISALVFMNLLFPPLYLALLPPIVNAAANARHSQHYVFSFTARSAQHFCSQVFPVDPAELPYAGAQTSDNKDATQEVYHVM